MSTVNNIFDSLSNRVDVKINDKSINDPTNAWYVYQAYFENHMSYSKATKSNLSYRGYFNDTRQLYQYAGGSVTGQPFQERKEKNFLQKANGYTFVLILENIFLQE